MTVSDTWTDWSTTPASNTPDGPATPEIDDELRNVKAVVKGAAVDMTTDQTIDGTKTFAHLPVLPAANPATVNQAVRAATIQSQAVITATAGGTGDALTVTLTPTLGAYAAGQLFTILLTADNTGATTIAFESLGAKDIKKRNNAGALVALSANDLKNGQEVLLLYDGTQFVLINRPSELSISAASEAEQEAGSEVAKYVAPATQQYHPSACKAWAQITGGASPTLAASYNVASIVHNSTGNFTITFTVAFSDGKYAVAGMTILGPSNYPGLIIMDNNNPPGAGSCILLTYAANGVIFDPDLWTVVFFGSQ